MEIPETINTHASLVALFERYCAECDWERALLSLNRQDRPEALLYLIHQFGVERLFGAINSVWIGTENAWGDEDIWVEVWRRVTWVWDRKARTIKLRQRRRNVMSKDEREFFNGLPDNLVLHRGFDQEGGWCGWSWTLDRSRAEWFARRYPGNPQVATIEILKAEVLAYFSGRDEQEIVIHPATLDGISDIKIEEIEQLTKCA